MSAPPQTPEAPPKESMGIDPFERNWMRLSIVLLIVFAGAVTAAGFALGFQVPGEEQRVDPATVTESGPFSNPGLRAIPGSDNEYELYVISRQFFFEPNVVEIPVGATVEIYVTSVDVQHGYKIQDTNINMQIVPGQVSHLRHTFNTVGEFPVICHEYCGLGHAAMAGTIVVTGGSS